MASYASHSGTTYAARTNTVLTPPAGIVDGDELILYFLIAASTVALIPAPTFPSGFSIVGGPLTVSQGNNTADFSVRSWTLRKRASGESGSYTVTHASASADGVLVRVSAGANATPVVTTNSGQGTGNITFLGITTAAANAELLAFCHNWQLWGAGTPPTGTTPTFIERQDSTTSIIHFSEGSWSSSGATGDKTKDSSNAAATDGWASMFVSIENGVSVSIEQEGSRGVNDDGSESTATFKAAQDTNVSVVPGQTTRLRIIINATGDPASEQYKLQYRKVGAASWRDLDTTG